MTKVGTAILPVSSLYHSCNFQKKHEKAVEKKQGSRAPRGPKVSNNFESVPARRNPARGAKFDGGVAESEAAGGSLKKKPQDQSPGKKPQCAETFLRCLDRTKAGRRPLSLRNPTVTPEAIQTIGPASLAASAARRPGEVRRRPSSPKAIWMIGPASPPASTARSDRRPPPPRLHDG